MKKSTGKEFEQLAESIFNKLVRDRRYENVERNVYLDGADGLRQIDILITTQTVGLKIRTVIECKDYNRKVSIGTIDEFHSKLIDINANKGIIISKKGFSSKSISKAKRLGIVLCTAHQALQDNWNPEIDQPILIEVVKPNNFELMTKFGKQGTNKFTFSKSKFPNINGFNIIDLMEKKWREGSLKIKTENSIQEISLEEIKKPFFQILENGEKLSLEDFKVKIKIVTKYYLTSLGELKNTKILNNISENVKTVFIEMKNFENFEKEFKCVSSRTKENFKGFFFTANITPNFSQYPSNISWDLPEGSVVTESF